MGDCNDKDRDGDDDDGYYPMDVDEAQQEAFTAEIADLRRSASIFVDESEQQPPLQFQQFLRPAANLQSPPPPPPIIPWPVQWTSPSTPAAYRWREPQTPTAYNLVASQGPSYAAVAATPQPQQPQPQPQPQPPHPQSVPQSPSQLLNTPHAWEIRRPGSTQLVPPTTPVSRTRDNLTSPHVWEIPGSRSKLRVPPAPPVSQTRQILNSPHAPQSPVVPWPPIPKLHQPQLPSLNGSHAPHPPQIPIHSQASSTHANPDTLGGIPFGAHAVSLVLDTNYLISHLPFVIDLLARLPIPEMIIVVPYVVVKELDALKEHNKKKFREHTEAVEKRVMGQLNTVEGGIVDNRTGVTLGNLARKAVDFLFKKLAAQHRGLKGQSLNDHISDSDIVGQMDNDDKILECCRFVIQRITPKTILMSNDKNLCVKALIHGITTVSNFKHSAESFLAEVRKISDLPPAPGGHPIVRGQASPVKGSTSLAGHINNIAPVAEVEMVDVQDATRSKERKRSKSKTPASPAPPMITSASRMQTRSAAQNAGQSKSLGSNTPSKRPTQPGNGSGASNSKVTPISQGHHLTDAAMFRDHSPMEVDEQKQKASQPVSKDQASRPGQQQQRSQVQPPTSSNGKQHQPTAGGSSKSKRKRGSDDQASADLMDVDGPAPEATEGAKKKRKGSLTAQLGERHGKTLILTTEQLREHHGKTQEKRTKDIKAGTSTDPIDVVCRDLLDTLPPLLTGAFINLLDYSIPGGQWDRTVTVRQPWNLEDLFGIMDEHWLHFGKVIGKGFKSSLSFCRQISRELVRGRRYGKTTATLGDLRRLMHALMSLTKLLRESKCLSNASHLDKVVKGMFNKLHPTEASN